MKTINKRLTYFTFVAFFIIVVLAISNNPKEIQEINKTLILGYCPTMRYLAQNIANNNENIELMQFGLTVEALNELNKGNADFVLVGRIAKRNEIEDSFELRLRSGLTLVSKEKSFIYYDALPNMEIHTAIDKEAVKQYLLESENIIFYNSTENAIKNGLNEIVLIDWSDYIDDFELVIPVDRNLDKIEKFRIPIIYTFNQEIIDKLNFVY